MSLDEMGVDKVLDLRNQKNEFLKEGRITELIKLKALYPELFDENKEKEIQELIDFCEYFSNTSHFKLMVREEKKRKLIAIDFDTWERGMLDDALKPLVTIEHENIHAIACALVKESLLIAFEQCGIEERTRINEVLPYMGILVNDILMQFSVERRVGHLSRALFKLRSAAFNNEQIDEVIEPQVIFTLSTLDQPIKNALHVSNGGKLTHCNG